MCVKNAIALISDTNLKYQTISLILNLAFTQNNPTEVQVIYCGKDENDSDHFIELVLNTNAILKRQNSALTLQYKIIESIQYQDLVGEFEVPKNSQITKTAYLRYFLDVFVDKRIEKLLYLDIDILVKRDINELFELEFDEVLAACLASPKSMALGEHLTNFSGEYFNSGVLLIDMNKWRDRALSKELVQVTRGKTFPFLDQDALNLVFQKNWMKINRKYNWFHDATKRQIDINEWPEPSIVHFVGRKPWKVCDETEYVVEYRKLFEKTRTLSKNLMN